jgi:multiple sugar transport system substrate-binding protein
MHMRPSRGRGRLTGIAVVAVLALAACTSSSNNNNTGGNRDKMRQVPLPAKQRIIFATAGLGSEEKATKTEIAGFEKLHPNITVNILELSSSSTAAQEQEQQYFLVGASTPDVLYTDVTWPSQYARAGWITNLESLHPKTSKFFPAQMATGEYNGGVYAIPWYINAEGLYYRTDLVKTPPTSISALVDDAKSALAKDKSLKEGLAFEGDEYEGAVSAWLSMGAQIGTSQLSNIDTAANEASLEFMYDAVHTYKIAPSAVTTWDEYQVQIAWLSGQTPFALNWPYLFQLSETKADPAVDGHTGWIPFPSTTPQSCLGGDDLAINAKSTHKAAAWAFIQYLTSLTAQDYRAVADGDPPSVEKAYDAKLYASAPYFKQERAVYNAVTLRPVTPVYEQLSDELLQPMISSVLSGEETPGAALAGTAPTVAQLIATAK